MTIDRQAFRRQVAADLRRGILDTLAAQGGLGDALNMQLLRAALELSGRRPAMTELEAAVDWLVERDLVQRTEMPGADHMDLVAILLGGLDIAQGRSRLRGVANRLPGS